MTSTHTQQRADLVAAIQRQATFEGQMRAVAALDAFDAARRETAREAASIDLANAVVEQRFSPVSVHEHHTASTDWLGQAEASATYGGHEIVAEAALWFDRTSPELRSDAEEFGVQAEGFLRRQASQYGERADALLAEGLSYLGFRWRREAASGLDQVQQTVDPNNSPKTTPLNPEVFDNFADEVDPINAGVVGTEQSTRAPLIQEIMQEGNGSAAPEKPGGHSTSDDFSGGYSEVPVGGTMASRQAADNHAACPNHEGQSYNKSTGMCSCGSNHRTWASSTNPGGMKSSALADDRTVALGAYAGTLDDFRPGGQHHEAASTLEQVQEVVDANNQPHPENPLPLDVMFPWLISPNQSNGDAKESSLQAEGAMTYHEMYGNVSNAQLSAYRSHNVPPAMHDELESYFGPSSESHGAITKYVKAKGKNRLNYGDVHRDRPNPSTGEMRSDDGGSGGFGRFSSLEAGGDDPFSSAPEGAHTAAGGNGYATWSRDNADWHDTPDLMSEDDEGWSREDAEEAKRMTEAEDPNHAHDLEVRPYSHPNKRASLQTTAGAGWESWLADARTQRGASFDPESAGEDDMTRHHYVQAYDAAYAGKRVAGGAHPAAQVGYQHGQQDYLRGGGHITDYRHGSTTADMFGNSDAPHSVMQPNVANTPDTTPGAADGYSQGLADGMAGNAATYSDGTDHGDYTKGYTDGVERAKESIPKSVPRSMGGDNERLGAKVGPGDGAKVVTADDIRRQQTSGHVSTNTRCRANRTHDIKDCTCNAKTSTVVCKNCGHVSHADGQCKCGCTNYEPANTAGRSRHSSLKTSSLFVRDEADNDPDFVKGYAFASRWTPESPIVARGSSAFEQGLFAGMTDNVAAQGDWVSKHAAAAQRFPEMAQRIVNHAAYTDQLVARGVLVKNETFENVNELECYSCGHRDKDGSSFFADGKGRKCPKCGSESVHHPDAGSNWSKGKKGAKTASADSTCTVCGKSCHEEEPGGLWTHDESGPEDHEAKPSKTAATSIDLDTVGPHTSPDPGGQTPINGPGTVPPLAGQADPARGDGPAPYNGAPPYGHPVVPTVPVPSAGAHTVNDVLGGPVDGNARATAAFRKQVQANLLRSLNGQPLEEV